VCVNSLCNTLGIDLPRRRLVGARSPVAYHSEPLDPRSGATEALVMNFPYGGAFFCAASGPIMRNPRAERECDMIA
jgi:hypothetical protein